MAIGKTDLAEAALQFLFGADNLTADRIESIAKDLKRLGASLQVEAKRVQHFKIDIHWKSRVINVPKAVEQVKQLIYDLTTGLKEKVQTIEQPFVTFAHDLKLIAETPPDPNVSALARGINEVQTFVTQLNILVGQVAAAIQSSLALTELFDRVLQDLQHLEDLFLQQKNPRQLDHLKDGRPIKLRIGNKEGSLHLT
jgi:methyl-accepting chemotaxis protein